MPGSTRAHWSNHQTGKAHLSFKEAGWHFGFRGSRRESAVAQLLSLGVARHGFPGLDAFVPIRLFCWFNDTRAGMRSSE